MHRTGSLLLARLQVLRAFHFVYVAGVLLAGGMLARLAQQQKRIIAALYGAVLLIMFAAQRITYPASSHVEWPGLTPRNPWQQSFLWIRSNTSEDAIFALDNDYIEWPGEDAQGFRATAERSAVADYFKDGGIASNFRLAAIPWWQGSQATKQLNSATDEQRLARLSYTRCQRAFVSRPDAIARLDLGEVPNLRTRHQGDQSAIVTMEQHVPGCHVYALYCARHLTRVGNGG